MIFDMLLFNIGCFRNLYDLVLGLAIEVFNCCLFMLVALHGWRSRCCDTMIHKDDTLTNSVDAVDLNIKDLVRIC